MSGPVLRYLLVQEYDPQKQIVNEDVERYTEGEYDNAFNDQEQLVLNAGLRLWRNSKVKPGTGFLYIDMVKATRGYLQDLEDNPS